MKEHIYFTDEEGNTTLIEENDIPAPPMGEQGVMATLMVVKGVLTIEDVQSTFGLDATYFEHEAKSWEMAKAIDDEAKAKK